MDDEALKKLWNLADKEPRARGQSPDGAFESIGLLLDRRLQRAPYGATPANAVSFAGTGGDGVHFSFITRGGAFGARSPVLMSVPMADDGNRIVGEDLVDFLSLGQRFGFFYLEQIVYQPDVFFAEYEDETTPSRFDVREIGRAKLARLHAAFRLSRWDKPKARLTELQKRFGDLLEPPPPSSSSPPVSALALWEHMLARELARPEHERRGDLVRHYRRKLAELGRQEK